MTRSITVTLPSLALGASPRWRSLRARKRSRRSQDRPRRSSLARSGRVLTMWCARGTNRSPRKGSPLAGTPVCSLNLPTAFSSLSVGRPDFRIPFLPRTRVLPAPSASMCSPPSTGVSGVTACTRSTVTAGSKSVGPSGTAVRGFIRVRVRTALRISPYDPERRVWVVNETFNTIYVFSNDGTGF